MFEEASYRPRKIEGKEKMGIGLRHAPFGFRMAGFRRRRDHDGGIGIALLDLAEQRNDGPCLPHRDSMDPDHFLSFDGCKMRKSEAEAGFKALAVFAMHDELPEQFWQGKIASKKRAKL